MTYIGIDPGLTGGIGIMTGGRIFGSPMPTYTVEVKTKRGFVKRRRYDLKALRRFFVPYAIPPHSSNEDAEWDPRRCYVTLEEAFPMPQQGVTSMFSIGLGYGILQGLFAGLDIELKTVHPKTWQSMFEIHANKETNTKEQALAVCKQLFPDTNLMASERSTIPHKGIVDALLICEWGRRFAEEEREIKHRNILLSRTRWRKDRLSADCEWSGKRQNGNKR